MNESIKDSGKSYFSIVEHAVSAFMCGLKWPSPKDVSGLIEVNK